MLKWFIENKEWLFSGIGITILGVIYFAIKKILIGKKNVKINSKEFNEIDFEKHFPRINKPILANFAKRISHKYQDLNIETITLYRYHSQHFSGVSTKYALVIEVNPNVKTDGNTVSKLD